MWSANRLSLLEGLDSVCRGKMEKGIFRREFCGRIGEKYRVKVRVRRGVLD